MSPNNHNATVSSLRTRFIRISPSYRTIYRSFEIVLEWKLVHWIGIQIQYSMQIPLLQENIQSDMNYI